MKKSFIIASLFLLVVIVGVFVYLGIHSVTKQRENSLPQQKDIVSPETLSTSSIKEIPSSQETTSTQATIPLLPARMVRELESKDLKITFSEDVYSPEPVSGASNDDRVQNFPPVDAGNSAWAFTTSTGWIVFIERDFVYGSDKNIYGSTCKTSLEKIMIDGRLVKICKSGFDDDMSIINAFIFDDRTKVMIGISSASPEAKEDALNKIEAGLKWK